MIFRSRSLWDQALVVDRGILPTDTIKRYAIKGPNGQTLWGLRRNITLPRSKTTYQITVAADADDETVKATALASENVQKFLGDKEPRKVIVIKGRLVNIVKG